MKDKNMKKTIGLVLIAGLMIVGTSSMVKADGYVGDSGVSIGPRASYYESKDGDDGEWMIGAQLRFFLSQALAIEGSIDYRREDYGQTKLHVYPVQASLLAYIIPQKPVGLYLLAGPGWYYTKIDRPSPHDNTTKHRFGLHAGGGLSVFINDFWSLDGSYRYIWLEKFSTRDESLENKDFSDSGHQYTIGLNYHF